VGCFLLVPWVEYVTIARIVLVYLSSDRVFDVYLINRPFGEKTIIGLSDQIEELRVAD